MGFPRIHLMMQEMQVRPLRCEDPLEEEMATHSSILAEKSHGWWRLAGCGPYHCKELRIADQQHTCMGVYALYNVWVGVFVS